MQVSCRSVGRLAGRREGIRLVSEFGVGPLGGGGVWRESLRNRSEGVWTGRTRKRW